MPFGGQPGNEMHDCNSDGFLIAISLRLESGITKQAGACGCASIHRLDMGNNQMEIKNDYYVDSEIA
jgi:hypothetical protein